VFWLQTARTSAAAASLHHHCCLSLCRDHHTLWPNELDKNNNLPKKRYWEAQRIPSNFYRGWTLVS
jgi:hypothetical protein